MALGTQVATRTIIASSLLSSLYGFSLAFMWEAVNTVQILVFMPLLSIKTPGFLFRFYKRLNEFNLQIFDFTNHFEKLLSTRFFKILDQKFNLLEFENNNIFINAAEIFLTLIAIALVLLLIAVVVKLCRFSKRLTNFAKKIKRMIVYGFIIRFALETSILAFLSVSIQFYDFKVKNLKEPVYIVSYLTTLVIVAGYF